MLVFLLGVTVTVDDSTDYMVNETDDAVNIFILLSQPSCRPIIVIANPQERLIPPSATGIIICSII